MKKMNFVVIFISLLSLPAMADYQQCVLSSLGIYRSQNACNFDDLQSQLITSNRGCNQEFIKLVDADPGPDAMKKVTNQIPQIKADTDFASEQLLQDEIEKCGFKGSVTIRKGGIDLKLIIGK